MTTPLVDLKIVLVGQQGCGKSAIISRYTKNKYSDEHVETKSISLASARVQAGSTPMRLICVDTPCEGESVTRVLKMQPDFVFVCFSLASQESLDEAIEKWMPEAREHAPRAVLVLIGCKGDISLNPKEENTRAAEEAEKQEAMAYLECSAKGSVGVKRLFDVAIKMRRHQWLEAQKRSRAGATDTTEEVEGRASDSDEGSEGGDEGEGSGGADQCGGACPAEEEEVAPVSKRSSLLCPRPPQEVRSSGPPDGPPRPCRPPAASTAPPASSTSSSDTPTPSTEQESLAEFGPELRSLHQGMDPSSGMHALVAKLIDYKYCCYYYY
eukprot:TRINITY_DN9667_c0_g1_i1.p1 TRINITY_DN9667_c0_g1~~TRINITY_DN9667_c0_g1_i1.p1  ORF type:complete len:342 (+),score=92.81 TRINITY_DN9667_c0_g1_i1:53-1027(+)